MALEESWWRFQGAKPRANALWLCLGISGYVVFNEICDGCLPAFAVRSESVSPILAGGTVGAFDTTPALIAMHVVVYLKARGLGHCLALAEGRRARHVDGFKTSCKR